MIEKVCRANMLKLADGYCRATGVMASTFSHRFHGTDSFLSDFRAGTVSITLVKYDKIVAALVKAWPDNKKWPKLAAIPAPKKRGKR